MALGHRMAKAPTKGLSTLNSMAFGFAVYASQGRSPDTTQDSLPVAGQALLDGVLTRKVPMKGFKVVVYISFPFPKLLGAIDATGASCQTLQPASVCFVGQIWLANLPAWTGSRRRRADSSKT